MASTERIRVLQVDDDPDFAEAAALAIERAADAMAVSVAEGGENALAHLEAEPVDCIVSDYEMPDMDGLELLEAVRADYPDLPFVLFTGKGSEAVASDAISAGVTDYIQKGTGSEQYEILANRIENAVRGYRARREIERSERRLRRVYERISDGFFAVDTDWEYTYVNETGAELVGRDPEDLVGQTVWDAFPGLLDSPFEPVLREAMASQERQAIEEYYPPHDTWYDVTVYAAEDGISIYFRDVSEQRANEQDLREKTQRLDLALEATDTGVWEWNMETDEVVWDESQARALDMEPGEFDGTFEAFRSLLHPEDEAHVERELEAAIERGEPYETEFRMIRADGEPRWFRARGEVIDDEGPDRMIGITADVTDRIQRERELERQNERLEAFTSVVSHDLRNPLNVAVAQLELAREDCDSEALEKVDRAHRRMRHLIEDLLTLAREGEEATSPEPVALADLVEACWTTVDTGEASLVVETDRTVRADRGQLRQLLENCFANAVEHAAGADAGPPTVTVGDREGGFFVADDGPGLGEADPDRLFEPGYSTDAGSTGFGLAIVRQIADAHGWDVTASERETGGTRFDVTGVEFA